MKRKLSAFLTAQANDDSIIVTKKGKLSPSRTAKERDKQLKKCPGGDSGIVSKIGDKFGGARGL